MNKISRLLLIFISVFSLAAMPVDSAAIRHAKSAVTKKGSARNRTSEKWTAKPYFGNLFFLDLPTPDKIDLKNPKDVKSVKMTESIYIEDDGPEGINYWKFSPKGMIEEYCCEDGDATGSLKYKVYYNSNDLIDSICIARHESLQDAGVTDGSLRFVYHPAYKNGRIVSITEQMRGFKGWMNNNPRKEVNLQFADMPVYTLDIQYDDKGEFKSARCVEDPKVFFTKEGGKLKGNSYTWTLFMRRAPKWTLLNNGKYPNGEYEYDPTRPVVYDENEAFLYEDAAPSYQYDSRGNWIRKSDGITREIEYYR